MKRGLGTIAHLKGHSLVGLFVACSNVACLHAAPITFEALGFPDELPFLTIAERKRVVCKDCGGRRASMLPDWRAHRAYGAGGWIDIGLRRLHARLEQFPDWLSPLRVKAATKASSLQSHSRIFV